MKKILFTISCFSLIFIFIPSQVSRSQEKNPECKVLLKEISGTYKGGCKDGLADGKGVATGEDSYEGTFRNGLPDGKGTYTFKSGTTYTGYFEKGVKNGKGKLRSIVNGKAMIMEGYWKDGNYSGTIPPEQDYRVDNLSGIEHYIIVRKDNSENIIEISFEKYRKKYLPDDLSVTVTSGYKSNYNLSYLIQKYALPVNCALHFTIPTGGGIRICNLSFTALRPGRYEVFIENN
jgi:hypothetical protein